MGTLRVGLVTDVVRGGGGTFQVTRKIPREGYTVHCEPSYSLNHVDYVTPFEEPDGETSTQALSRGRGQEGSVPVQSSI